MYNGNELNGIKLPQLHSNVNPQPPIPLNSNTTEVLECATSSWLAKMEYDISNYRMTVFLKDGHILQRLFVFPAEWTALKLAPSKGSHYSKNFKQHPTVTIKQAMKSSKFPDLKHKSEDK